MWNVKDSSFIGQMGELIYTACSSRLTARARSCGSSDWAADCAVTQRIRRTAITTERIGLRVRMIGVSQRSKFVAPSPGRVSLQRVCSPTRIVPRLNRSHDRSAFLYVRLQISQAIRFRANNQDRKAPAHQVLLVLKALVHCDEQAKPAFSASESK